MLAALLLAAVPLVADMTPERVREALATGAASKEDPLYRLKGSLLETRVALFSTPFARAARIGYMAKRAYRTVDESAVEARFLEPYVEVFVYPFTERASRFKRPKVIGVQNVVVTGPNGINPVQPSNVATNVQTFKNALGATWEAQGLVVRFPLDVVRADSEVHVIYADGDDKTFRFDVNKIR